MPDFNTQIAAGDFKDAFKSFVQTMLDNGTVREELITWLFTQTYDIGTITEQIKLAQEDLEGVFKATGWLEFGLQLIDSSAVFVNSSTENAGETWSGWVVPKPVNISPSQSYVNGNVVSIPLTVTPANPSPSDTPFVYNWSVKGNAGGGLEGPNDTSGSETALETTSPNVTYAEGAFATNGQQDVVTVDVYVNIGTSASPIESDLVGQATSTINVDTTPCGPVPTTHYGQTGYIRGTNEFSSVTVSPNIAKQQQSVTFSATIPAGELPTNLTDPNFALRVQFHIQDGYGFEIQSIDGVPVQNPHYVSTATDPTFSFPIPNPSETVTHSLTFALETTQPEVCSQIGNNGPNGIYIDVGVVGWDWSGTTPEPTYTLMDIEP